MQHFSCDVSGPHRSERVCHKELKGATVILKLALLKAMLSEWMPAKSHDDAVASWMECRNQEGQFLEVAIPHVLSFL
jgi:hypothetical protein